MIIDWYELLKKRKKVYIINPSLIYALLRVPGYRIHAVNESKRKALQYGEKSKINAAVPGMDGTEGVVHTDEWMYIL
ncbi:MAG: hypothetical protein GY765_06600 [bacterium]|nr:hypothetical protein [bacterium]